MRDDRRQRELLLRLVLTALLLYALARLGLARQELGRCLAHEEEARTAYRELCVRHEELERRLDAAEDPASLEALARRRLGLVMPGEIVFYFNGD